MSMIEADAKANRKQLKKFLGATITDIIEDPTDGEFTGIVIKTVFQKRHVLWIQCDPEGNGGGFVDIQELK